MPARPAIVSDAAEIARLSGQLGYPATPEEVGARVRAMSGSPNHAVLVAAENSHLLGWVHVCRRLTVEREYAEITSLVVDESRRSQGTGAMLLAAAEGWARNSGLPMMRVRSNVIRDRAHGFYLKHGYAVKKKQVVFDKAL